MDNNENQQQSLQESKSGNSAVGVVVLVVLAMVGGLWLLNSKKATPVTPDQDTKIVDESVVKGESTSNSDLPTSTYTLADVAKHANESSCWMAIEGKVYDVTSFIGKHPGGKAIMNGCGKDATILFNERPTENKGPHPAQAKEMLVPLYIGDLKVD